MRTWDITGSDAAGYRVYDTEKKEFTHTGTFATLKEAQYEASRAMREAADQFTYRKKQEL